MKTIPRSIRKLAAMVGATFGLALPAGLHAQDVLVDLELSLVVDVSGSVNSTEYALQMGGYATAFENSRIHSAISSGTQGQIAVNLIQYGSTAAEIIGWTLLTDAASSNAFADTIRNAPRFQSEFTSISSGIDLAVAGFGNNGFDGTRKVIDVSGDGTNNEGRSVTDARDDALAAGIDVINGLPILLDVANLDEYYEDNVQGGTGSFTLPAATFEDFEDAVLVKLEAEILGRPPVATTPEAGLVVSSTLRTVSVASSRTVTRDVGGRLSKLRSGVRSETTQTVTPAPAPTGPKGGMAKGGMSKSPIITTHRCPWEVWAQVYYSTEDLDQQLGGLFIPGPATAALPARQVLLRPDTSIDTYGGTVGVDYDIDDNWTVGFAVGAARTDVDMRLVGTTDIDTLSLMPYVSYYREISATMAFYADLMYAYGMMDYDTMRLPTGAIGNTDGDFHSLEFNTGLNFKTGSLVHGPFAQVRYLDGTIDSYTENGPGALFFPESDFESLATQLGYSVAYVIDMGSGKLVPRFSAAWEHEFEADQNNVFGLPTATLDEDLAVLGVGIAYYMNCGWNLGIDYEARLGSDTEAHYVGLKGGIEF